MRILAALSNPIGALGLGRSCAKAIVLVCLCAYGVAYAAPCDISGAGNFNTYVALGAGSCTLPNGATLSNFRYSSVVTGTAVTPTTTLWTFLPFANSSTFSAQFATASLGACPPACSITLNIAYTITAASGFNITANNFTNDVVAGATTTETESLCPGGTFTGLPPASCSTTIINRPGITSPPSGSAGSLAIGPVTSTDLFFQNVLTPGAVAAAGTQTLNFTAIPPPPPTTPVPPSVILTLTGMASLGLFQLMRLRRRGLKLAA